MMQDMAVLAYCIPLTLTQFPSKAEQIYPSLPTSFLGAQLKGRVSKEDVFSDDGKNYYLVVLATKEFAAERYWFPDTPANHGLNLSNKAWRYFVGKEGDGEDGEKYLNQAVETGNVAALFNKAILIRNTQPEACEELLKEAQKKGYKNAEVALLEGTQFTSREKELDAFRAFVEKGNLLALSYFSCLAVHRLPAERLCFLDRELVKERAFSWEQKEEPLSFLVLGRLLQSEEGKTEEALKYYTKAHEFNLIDDIKTLVSLEHQVEEEREEKRALEKAKEEQEKSQRERTYVDLLAGGSMTSSADNYRMLFSSPEVLKVLA